MKRSERGGGEEEKVKRWRRGEVVEVGVKRKEKRKRYKKIKIGEYEKERERRRRGGGERGEEGKTVEERRGGGQ